MKSIYSWFKIGFNDKVDLIMILLIAILASIDLFTLVDLTGALGFVFVYCLGFVGRLGWWKDAANKYVTDPEYRIKLKLPRK